jgi:hypothetical protein
MRFIRFRDTHHCNFTSNEHLDENTFFAFPRQPDSGEHSTSAACISILNTYNGSVPASTDVITQGPFTINALQMDVNKQTFPPQLLL